MRKIVVIFIVTLFITVAFHQVSACTGFTASDGENVLGGHNEDWFDPDFYIRFFPADEKNYGCMFIIKCLG